jgi:hypothetical protein
MKMSNKNLKKYKKEILRLSEKRQKLLQLLLSNQLLILGSYTETRMRCSSPGCHCHKDGGHPTMRISHWYKGKLKSKVVRIDDRQWVAEAAANYKAHKQALRDIAEVNNREKEVLKLILEQKAQIYE